LDFLLNIWLWIITGLVLIAAEIVLPGGVIAILGLACLVVAATLATGLISSWMHALTLFFITSIVLLISLGGVIRRMMGGEATIQNTDEEVDAFGEVVEVVETIGPGETQGRVMFRGISWQAVGDGSKIAAGEKAQVISRDNIILVVEKASETLDSALLS
jgi:membrane protein implicated in regulation of membrane protease activity